jgi:hypothetical protein
MISALVAGIEVARGLVGENQRWSVDQSPGNGDALLLPSRQLARGMIETIIEPHHAEHFDRPRVALLAVKPVVHHRQLDIFKSGRARQQVESLKDEADALVADVRPLVGGQRADLVVFQEILTAGGAIKTAKDIHESRFAGAGRTHDRDKFAKLDPEADTTQGGYLHIAHAVGFSQIFDPDEFAHRKRKPPCCG